jgi:hypothetical protein
LPRNDLCGGHLCGGRHEVPQKQDEQRKEPFVHHRLQLRSDPFAVALKERKQD